MPTYAALRARLQDEPATWLVTGAAGFIGSNLLETLLELDQQVIGLDNFATGKRDNLAEVESAVGPAKWKHFRFIEGDIRSPRDCRAACRSVRYVLHHAAQASVPQSIEDPVSCHDSNVSGFLDMLVAARDAGVSRFVYAGSSAAYGDAAGLPAVEGEIGNAAVALRPDQVRGRAVRASCSRAATASPRSACAISTSSARARIRAGAYAAVIPLWVASLLGGPTRAYQRRRADDARLLPRRQRGAGKPARRDRRRRGGRRPGLQHRAGRGNHARPAVRDDPSGARGARRAAARPPPCLSRLPARTTCTFRKPTSARRCACSATGRQRCCERDWRGRSTGMPGGRLRRMRPRATARSGRPARRRGPQAGRNGCRSTRRPRPRPASRGSQRRQHAPERPVRVAARRRIFARALPGRAAKVAGRAPPHGWRG